MDAVILLHGRKTNFFRWPFRTYRSFKSIVSLESNSDLIGSYNTLLKRFKIFGILSLMSLLLYLFAIAFFSGGGCFGLATS